MRYRRACVRACSINSLFNLRLLRQPRPTQESKISMSVDIRRMTKEELDALNEQGRLWRARNKPAQGEQAPETNPTVQMDLWEKEGNER
jgi:hypothetical protein